MTDTGQVPGEGLPENAGMVEQPGVSAHGAYAYLSETTAEDEDLLLPGSQGAWGNEVAPPAPEPVVEAVHDPAAEAVHEPGPHELSGRDSGSVDLGGVRLPDPPPIPPITPRRPLHLGPPIPNTSASPVRSLADRGPADAPARQPGPPTVGPEYLDVPRAREMPAPQVPPQAAAPWGAQAAAQAPVSAGAAPAETVVPAARPVAAAQAVAEQVATEAGPAQAVAPVEPGAAAAGQPAEAGSTAQAAPVAQVQDGGHAAQAPQGAMAAGEHGGVAYAPSAEQEAAAEGSAGEPGHGAVDGSAGAAAHGAADGSAEEAGPGSAADSAESDGQGLADAAVASDGQILADAVVADAQQQEAVAPDQGAEQGQSSVTPVSDAEQGAETALSPEGAAVPEHAQVPEAVPAVDAAEEPQSVAQGPEVTAAEGVAQAPAVTDPEPAAQAPEPTGPETVAAPAEAPATGAVGQAAEPMGPEAVAHDPAVTGTEAAAQAPEATTPEAAAPAQETVGPEAAQTSETVAAPLPAAEGTEPAPGPEPVGSAPAAEAAEATPFPAAADAAQSPHPADGSPAPAEDVSVVPTESPLPQADTEPAVQGHPEQPLPEAQPIAEAQPMPEAQALPEAQPLQTPQTPQPVQGPQQAHAFPPAPDAQASLPAQPGPVDAAPQDTAAAPTASAPHGAAIPTPDAPAQPTDVTSPATAPEPAPADTAPAPAPEAPTEPGHADAATLPGSVPAEPQPEQPIGQFVPGEGSVPTAPHLAPTTPQPVTAEQPVAEPTAEVPAPVEAEAETAAAAQPDPDLVQSADDLDTRAADQEDLEDRQDRQDLADQQAQTEESTATVAEARQSTGPAAPPYDDAEREAVLKVMRERRDIRNGFRSDPIPHEVLLRVLEAAHTAPSVGHSQPWDFVVIRSADTRRSMHELAMRQREAYAKSLPKGRAKQFKELKIEAILDTPVNIVVTADPTRGGRHTLGRHTQPQMAPYSAALAVENLWLAARAEGLGVGWVSFFDEREMVRALGLPEHLEVIAYLCVGYVDEFPDEPELMQAGWSKRRPLSWVVHEETYGRRALPGEEPHDLLAETVAQIRPLDAKALGEAWERQKRMTKPAGALGMLEIISAQLSGLSRQCPPPIPEPAAVAIFAGDHGVHAQGVTPWPQEVTAQMVANFLGGGAVCNAFATQVGAEVCVVDVGVAADLPATPGLLPRKVRAGTSDMTTGPAMTREEAKQAIEVGIETARDLVAAGNKALLTGEMGIANTTASAALISVYTGADPAEVTGRGTGINDETLARKTEVVRRALELHQPDPADPIGVLAAIGGFEHAAIVGLLLGGASLRTPVILDGVSAGAAALVARAIAPEVLAACIAGHRSAEPGHVAALNKLGLRPLVDLDLRLGEGTGALLALPLVQSTARAMHEVATFDSAGVTEK
ncbi:hypothetical protein GCM10027074_22230 [Streptomyces deserti]